MNKRILFLNLPYKNQIVRRYMCSYDSPESLLPPIELISLASVAREKVFQVELLDSIAEKKSFEDVVVYIKQYEPEYIVTLTGFECYEEDVNCIKNLKYHFPEIQLVTFGYYATEFPEETLRNSSSNFVLLGEPDMVFKEFLTNKNIEGVCYIHEGEFINNGASKRIKDFEKIPTPAYDLLKDKYFEPFVERPYGMIQTMRGCPYQCNYCVKSFGSFTTSLSANDIIEHVKIWIDLHKVKTIRFIDDTFT
jgi:anaerobic magnesium-protoporphyrin IX monomethyl ester cyclase